MHLWFNTSISLLLVDVQVAKEHGYTKVVLGVSSSRIAARAIAATAKVSEHLPPAMTNLSLGILILFHALGMPNLST